MARIESGLEFNKDENHQKLKKQMEEITQYTLRIPVNLHQQVKIKLANDRRNLRGVLLEMLEEYVKK